MSSYEWVMDRDPDRYLKMILIQWIASAESQAADLEGLAGFSEDWAVVMENVSKLNTYSHEVGHSFNFIVKKDGRHHGFEMVKAPADGIPPHASLKRVLTLDQERGLGAGKY